MALACHQDGTRGTKKQPHLHTVLPLIAYQGGRATNTWTPAEEAVLAAVASDKYGSRVQRQEHEKKIKVKLHHALDEAARLAGGMTTEGSNEIVRHYFDVPVTVVTPEGKSPYVLSLYTVPALEQKLPLAALGQYQHLEIRVGDLVYKLDPSLAVRLAQRSPGAHELYVARAVPQMGLPMLVLDMVNGELHRLALVRDPGGEALMQMVSLITGSAAHSEAMVGAFEHLTAEKTTSGPDMQLYLQAGHVLAQALAAPTELNHGAVLATVQEMHAGRPNYQKRRSEDALLSQWEIYFAGCLKEALAELGKQAQYFGAATVGQRLGAWLGHGSAASTQEVGLLFSMLYAANVLATGDHADAKERLSLFCQSDRANLSYYAAD